MRRNYTSTISYLIMLLMVILTRPASMQAQCTANFTSTNNLGGNVSFSGTATGTVNPTYYLWTFGAGPNAFNTLTPSVTYTANGVYNVCLFVYVNQTVTPNCQVCQTVNISNAIPGPCNAVASFTNSAPQNGMVQFASTSTGTVSPTTYTWAFGDGTGGSGANPSKTYTMNGTYVVTLSITSGVNPNTCTSTSTGTITVNNACFASASFTSVNGQNGSVQFSSTSTGTVNPVTYNWAFGDGTTGNGSAPTKTYNLNGVYTVSLTVVTGTNPNTCTSVAFSTVNIQNAVPCFATASFTSLTGQNGSVQFGSTSTGTVNPVTYNWVYGDGTNGSGPAPNKTYTANGVYTVSLTVITGSNPNTCVSTASAAVSVTNAAPPPCNASFSYSMMPNGNVLFFSTSTNTSIPTYYNWTFGNGATGSGPIVVHTYTASGVYTVNLSINNGTNQPACSSGAAVVFTVTNNGVCTPSVNFFMYKDLNVPLTWYAIPMYGGSVTAANWSWGDGTNTNGLYPSHTYTSAGNYSICVSATMVCGTNSFCVNQNIFKSVSGENNAMININVVQGQPYTTGIEKYTSEAINNCILFPNPADDHITLKYNSAGGSARTDVIDVTGRVVQSTVQESSKGSNEILLNTSALPSGLYFVKISIHGESKTLRFVRE